MAEDISVLLYAETESFCICNVFDAQQRIPKTETENCNVFFLRSSVEKNRELFAL